ncbi:MAG: UMP kinase [Clostridia bacterium]|nr:UMP kinase [Clostridia bacterium]
MELKYKRILIKVSGEALSSKGNAFDPDIIAKTVEEIKSIHDMGVELGVVMGGGNIWRGRQGREMDRPTADYMGMLATAINALCLSDALERAGVECRILTGFAIDKVGELFNQTKAKEYLAQGKVLLFACGTGNPFFTTDTGAALRGCEIGADVMLLAKNIDGIYDSDPRVNPKAVKFDSITYQEYLSRDLKVMDASAVSICADAHLKVLLFGLNEKDSIRRAVLGEKMGTLLY